MQKDLGIVPLLVVGAAILATLGCSDSFGEGAFDNEDFEPSQDAGFDTSTPGPGGDGFDDAPLRLTAPTSSRSFVFIANSTNGTLAKVAVDGDAIVISTVRVGANPTLVRTNASSDTALVLNQGSDSVSVVRAGPVGGEDQVVTVDVLPACNALALAPAGDWAFAWYDNAVAQTGDRAGSLSEVTAIRLLPGGEEALQLSVGVNVRALRFDAAGETAFIVTDDGVSVVPLAELVTDRFVAPVPVAGDELGAEREVEITADGRRAVVREQDVASLRVVDLLSGSRREVAMEVPPSDLDLLPSGDRVLVSLGDAGKLALVDLTLLAADDVRAVRTIDVEGHAPDSAAIAADGRTALAWDRTGGVGVTLASLVALDSLDVTLLNLRKGVAGAAWSPAGDRAIVVHTREPGEPVAGAPEVEIIARSSAFSVVGSDGALTKLVLTRATPTEIAFTEDGRHAFALVADAARAAQSVWWTDLQTLQTTELSFSRLPEHVGVVPGSGLVWVSQVHELGRIAFIDIETGRVREITGFELNSFIE